MKRVLAATALMVCAGMTQAEAPASSEKTATGDKVPAKLVCFLEPTTGSHLKKRVCMTEEERARQREAAQTAAERINRSAPTSAGRDKSAGK